jgi:hypothetical protein
MSEPEPLRISCETPEQAKRVLSALLERDVEPVDLVVCSAEPFHDIGYGVAGGSRLPYFVVGGALAGALGGLALAVVTARLYPLDTGGMPIVAWLPVGIVTYESMMLLAVLFTVGGLLLETRMLRRVPSPVRDYARRVSDGEILIMVKVRSSEQRARLLGVAGLK